MGKWQFPKDDKLPAVPPPGIIPSPHTRWIAGTLTKAKERSAKQQAWLDMWNRNFNRVQLPGASTALTNLPNMAMQADLMTGGPPLSNPNPNKPNTQTPPPHQARADSSSAPLPSAAVSARQSKEKSGNRIKRTTRRTTEEQEELIDGAEESEENEVSASLNGGTPSPHRVGSPEPFDPTLQDGDDDPERDPDDDDGDPDDDNYDEDPPPSQRPPRYPATIHPPGSLQPYDQGSALLVEKVGQMANQMMYLMQENARMAAQVSQDSRAMAQLSASESREAAKMLTLRSNELMGSLITSNKALIDVYQSNSIKLIEAATSMVTRADTRLEKGEAAQIKAMDTLQRAFQREAQATAKIYRQGGYPDDLAEEEETEEGADGEPEEGEGEGSEAIIGNLLGLGIKNFAGDALDRFATKITQAMGLNGTNAQAQAEAIKTLARETYNEERAKSRAARTAQGHPPPDPAAHK